MYNNTFYKHLSKDEEKLKIFKEGISQGKITPFDVGTLSRLRRIYYSCYSALIYIYGIETSFRTIGNKVELMTLAFENDDYTIIHANTDSTREIPFFTYQQEHLDSNSYLEVKRGRKTLIYDLFSMLVFEKEIYERLEHPDVIRISTKEKVQFLPTHNDDKESFSKPHDLWLACRFIPFIEQNLENSPYKEILSKELLRYKDEIDFEKVLLEWRITELEIHGNQKRK